MVLEPLQGPHPSHCRPPRPGPAASTPSRASLPFPRRARATARFTGPWTTSVTKDSTRHWCNAGGWQLVPPAVELSSGPLLQAPVSSGIHGVRAQQPRGKPSQGSAPAPQAPALQVHSPPALGGLWGTPRAGAAKPTALHRPLGPSPAWPAPMSPHSVGSPQLLLLGLPLPRLPGILFLDWKQSN